MMTDWGHLPWTARWNARALSGPLAKPQEQEPSAGPSYSVFPVRLKPLNDPLCHVAFRGEEGAAGTMLATLVASSILLASIGAVIWATGQDSKDARPVDEAVRRSDAEALAQMLVGSTGQGWQHGPDALVRLGLMNTNGSGLDLEKMEALRGAAYESLPNDAVDYPDALAGLGLDSLDGASDLHVRIYPVGLKKVLAEHNLSHIRTMYIGDWTSLDPITIDHSLSAQTMADDAQVRLDLQVALRVAEERHMLRQLGVDFTDRIHISGSQPDVQVEVLPGVMSHITDVVPLSLLEGDVYPDHKQYLDAHIHRRIGDYDLVVVGSGVAQSTLTSAVTKQAIADWVLAGGDLMVLGSGSQDFQWLQPLFSLGTSTANGQAFAPDVNHPMLQEPHRLNWPAYDNGGITWNLKDSGSNAHYDSFEHVIGAPGNKKDEDVLTVSVDGAFGEGRVFLTGYQPKEIAATLGMSEALNFVQNMVVYADRDHLFMDYGPTVPQDAAVASAIRHSHVWDSQLGPVPVRVEVLVWR